MRNGVALINADAHDGAASPPPTRALSRRRARRLAVSAALAVLLWPPLAWLAAEGLVVDDGASARADAVAVLSGSSAYVERARAAARLFREGRASLVILTDDGGRGGWSPAEQRNPSFVERAEAELLREGVPASAVERLPGPVSSTREEALLLREHAGRRRLRSLVVVTSPYHTRRARRAFTNAFERSGVEVAVAASERIETPPAASWWLTAGGWRAVAGEYVKLAYYAARGWS